MENKNFTEKEELKKRVMISKKTLYIIGSLLAILLTVGFFIFLNRNKKSEALVNKKTTDSSLISKKNPAKDSTENIEEYDEGRESPYSEYRVISNTVTLPNGKLNFGDKVFVDDSKSNQTIKIAYLKNPYTNPNSPSYSINASYFIDDYRFNDYKNNFSLSPFSELAPSIKKILLEENYEDGNKYSITQNEERAKSSVAFGDFDGDSIKDVAILMDNNEKQICRLLIICNNKATKQPYIAFAENYSDKMKIRGFKKNAPVYMNSQEFVASPQDGVIVKGEDVVLAVIYNSDLQKFKTFSQE